MDTIRLPGALTRLPGRAGLGRLGRVFLRAMDVCERWSLRVRERRRLAAFSDAMLKDIGISRADAMVEFDKPFWRP